MHRSEWLRRSLKLSPLLPAPMCGYSDRPFRTLLHEMGAHLVYTEMFSSEAMVRGDPNTWRMMDYRDESAPVVVQIFGSRPSVLAEAACIAVRTGASMVDLNLGCPARKIVKANSGSALLNSPATVRNICRSIRRAIDVPFTVKTRWHPDGRTTPLVARICEDEGVDAFTLHARTPAQGYSGVAQWEWIAKIRRILTIPVIGNGDIREFRDIVRMREETGCDAVMAGRGIVGNPWLMQQAAGMMCHGAGEAVHALEPDDRSRLRTLYRHAQLMYRYRGDHGLIEFRKHCAGYIRGLPGARTARQDLMRITELDALRECLVEHFGPF